MLTIEKIPVGQAVLGHMAGKTVVLPDGQEAKIVGGHIDMWYTNKNDVTIIGHAHATSSGKPPETNDEIIDVVFVASVDTTDKENPWVKDAMLAVATSAGWQNVV